MPSTLPLPTVVSDPHQAYPSQVKLPCILFLKTHFEHGGVDRKGHDTLYRMVEMVSAIGWEVHVISRSKVMRGGALVDLKQCMRCILQGCDAFNKNISAAVTKAFQAANTLPELEDMRGDELDTKLTQWRWKLR